MKFLRLLFDPRGRIGRGWYWLGTFAVLAFCVLVMVFVGSVAPDGAESTYRFVMMTMTFLMILVIATFGAIGAKRLHDRGRNALWLVLFYPAPAALFWFGTARQEPSLGMAAASGALFLWGLIELGFLPGMPGENAYGPNPTTGLTARDRQPTLPGA
jgi:uncharacterized membrane protein YhaH (DUF805 family)